MRRQLLYALLILLLAFTLTGCITDPGEIDTSDGVQTPNTSNVDGEQDDASKSEDGVGVEDTEEDGEEGGAPPEVDGELVVRFFDVGQADATLLQSPNATILIDAGHWQQNDIVTKLEANNVSRIDLMILTHPHADHIGQADAVLENFDVGEVWMSGDSHTSATFEEVVDAIERSDPGYYEPRAGEVFEVEDIEIEVLHPAEGDLDGDLHSGSIAVRINYGSFAGVWTSDAEASAEEAILLRSVGGEADVYQLGHHGSSTSSSKNFLQTMDPDVGVYSAASDSQYGHPHADVVSRFEDLGIELYGTGEHGTVTVTVDGDGSYTVKTEEEATLVTPFIDPYSTDGMAVVGAP